MIGAGSARRKTSASSKYLTKTNVAFAVVLVVCFIVIYKFAGIGAVQKQQILKGGIVQAISADTSLLGGKLIQSTALEGVVRTGADGKICLEGPIEVLSWSPRIFHYHGFLTDEECDYLISKAEPLLARSSVVGEKGDLVSDVRTSTGAFVSTDGDKTIMNIEQRIAEWTMIPVEHGESFYVLKYEKGQLYKPHFDYFEGPGAEKYIGDSGQRVATVLLYLATPTIGGETVFPSAKVTVNPVKGDAVLFYDFDTEGNPDPSSLHGGNPVIEGVKYCCTKWIRMRPYPYNWYSQVKPRN